MMPKQKFKLKDKLKKMEILLKTVIYPLNQSSKRRINRMDQNHKMIKFLLKLSLVKLQNQQSKLRPIHKKGSRVPKQSNSKLNSLHQKLQQVNNLKILEINPRVTHLKGFRIRRIQSKQQNKINLNSKRVTKS